MPRLFRPAVSAEVDFYSRNFTVFYAEDREQGRVTDRDRGHQVLANDRRGKGEGSRTFQRGDAKATQFLADFQALLDFISNLWGLTADAIF